MQLTIVVTEGSEILFVRFLLFLLEQSKRDSNKERREACGMLKIKIEHNRNDILLSEYAPITQELRKLLFCPSWNTLVMLYHTYEMMRKYDPDGSCADFMHIVLRHWSENKKAKISPLRTQKQLTEREA